MELPGVQILHGDCLTRMSGLADRSVQMCVTSPPYFGLRDYGVEGQIGLEETPDAYITKMVEVFREVRRVLADDGTLWLNIGDSYAGYWGDAKAKVEGRPSRADRRGFSMNSRPKFHDAFGGSSIKPKDMIGIPWMLAFALRADGWYLRQEIIWHKPHGAPEGKAASSRFTRAHESLFLLAKSYRYSFKDEQKLRSVWSINPSKYRGAHFATFPPALVEPCILAGSKPGDIVLDPFNGSGTTGQVALQHGRRYIGCELNADYIALTFERLKAANDNQRQMELT